MRPPPRLLPSAPALDMCAGTTSSHGLHPARGTVGSTSTSSGASLRLPRRTAEGAGTSVGGAVEKAVEAAGAREGRVERPPVQATLAARMQPDRQLGDELTGLLARRIARLAGKPLAEGGLREAGLPADAISVTTASRTMPSVGAVSLGWMLPVSDSSNT
eukprot:scaffold59269_cov28-Tisochrysis_lutea.AAC.4